MGSFVTLNQHSLKSLLEDCHNCTKGNPAQVYLGNTLCERLGKAVHHPLTFLCCDTTISAEGAIFWHSQDITPDAFATTNIGSNSQAHKHNKHQITVDCISDRSLSKLENTEELTPDDFATTSIGSNIQAHKQSKHQITVDCISDRSLGKFEEMSPDPLATTSIGSNNQTHKQNKHQITIDCISDRNLSKLETIKETSPDPLATISIGSNIQTHKQSKHQTLHCISDRNRQRHRSSLDCTSGRNQYPSELENMRESTSDPLATTSSNESNDQSHKRNEHHQNSTSTSNNSNHSHKQKQRHPSSLDRSSNKNLQLQSHLSSVDCSGERNLKLRPQSSLYNFNGKSLKNPNQNSLDFISEKILYCQNSIDCMIDENLHQSHQKPLDNTSEKKVKDCDVNSLDYTNDNNLQLSEVENITVKCENDNSKSSDFGEDAHGKISLEQDPLRLDELLETGEKIDDVTDNVYQVSSGKNTKRQKLMGLLGQQTFASNSLSTDSSKGKKYPESFACEFCGKVFAGKERAYQFYYHRNREHTREMIFRCDICSREFWGDRELVAHKTIHKEQEHMCHVCGKVFSAKKNLKVHLSVHASAREHVCPYCDKGFRRKDHLDVHERTHTGVRPYQCQFCDSAYPQKQQLNLHYKRCPVLKCSDGKT